MSEENNNFNSYLSTAFSGKRDADASYKFYEGDYDGYIPANKEASILDIGCGNGEFITYLMSKGFKNISGVDASPEMVDFCKNNGINCVGLVSNLKEYLSGRAGKFDLVTMNDVIEHLPKNDVVGILKAVKISLKDTGVFLLRTGNFSTLGGIYLRYKDFTHEIGYTESSLEQVLAMAGFKDVRVWGNKCYIKLNPVSIIRSILLNGWFFMLKSIYTVELGYDRPRIYSKLLVAACKK